MHVVMKKPPSRRETEAAKKKRKSNSGKKRAAAEIDKAGMSTEDDDMSNKPVAKGTTTAHFVKFINELLDIMYMDDGMKGHYLVLDNASIHKSKPMIRKTESRGYRVMYLPPYSPELNPIEQFWVIVKGKIKRDRLMTEKIYLVELQMPVMMCSSVIFMASVVIPSVKSSTASIKLLSKSTPPFFLTKYYLYMPIA
ncbi:hypothetical protein G6F60_012315 [Rhizopus arrhizus]|nr:hypothetical protein G6F60_012315 [Rhizopus arrhizus]